MPTRPKPHRRPHSRAHASPALAAALAPLTTDRSPLTTLAASLTPDSRLLTPASLRDALGRFLPGCPPGPGRPPKAASNLLHHVPPGQLYLDLDELEHAARAWKNIIRRLGPDAAADFLKDLEATHGRIRFRHVALSAIAKAKTEKRAPNKSSSRRKAK